uniref:BPTI/Kunitz inhibitor domain-containing protein n=1 Tax=Heterorhabditis bacteriophora TaxID=37862 RepID=A0A1I7X3A6_HETBA
MSLAHSSVLSQVPERCSFSKDGGFGKGYNVKWQDIDIYYFRYFNMRNLRCEQFVYEGQGGNSNQFETLSDCERFCSHLNENLEKTHLPSCPNGIQEIRYADGRAVMCLPGKNQVRTKLSNLLSIN